MSPAPGEGWTETSGARVADQTQVARLLSTRYHRRAMALVIGSLTVTYVLSAVALAVYGLGTLLLLALWWRHRHRVPPLPLVDDADLPAVTVQLPVYNERAVIGRLIDAVAALDYPRDRLRVQVLDDSTDDTGDLIARRVMHHAQAGLDIAHLRREGRTGYKAGALALGLARTSDELIAVFDADFVPPADFLRRVAPYFRASARLGMVQTRWAHLNPEENLLTRAQALILDSHFVIEQTARSRGGLLLNFSGSAGVWRADCIRDAGGWSDATLSEDLDLSYRAQLRGWRFLYLPDVAVPAEIPPQLAAYKQQQARWAKGNTQNLLRLGGALWRSECLTLRQKFMSTLHLCQYVVHPLMLLLLLLAPPLLWAGALHRLPLAPLGLAGLGPPLLYGCSQRYLYGDWPRRLLAFPALVVMGTGLALSNTLAVVDALRGRPNVFRRTPKFHGEAWQRSRYALGTGRTAVGEALLAIYAAAGGLYAVRVAPSLAPFLFIYAVAFGAVAVWSVMEDVLLRLGRDRGPAIQGRLSI